MAKKQKKVKIVLWTHVQNEAPIIRRMLESAADYIDYWVIVDNGSTDGTQKIIEDFFAEKDIPGKLYQSEIGWVGHGVNRQHSWDFLQKTDHGCEYILRIDADEGIIVDDSFDWGLLSGHEAYHVIYTQGGFSTLRMWLWRADVDWHWAPDVAHETIHLKSGKEPDAPNLPYSFRHVGYEGGNSYEDPIKYIRDVLKLEIQLHERLRDGSTPEQEKYHLLYLCKSFNYTGLTLNSEWAFKYFPYGMANIKNFLERGVFYYEQYLKKFEKRWQIYYGLAQLHKALGQTHKYLVALRNAHNFGPQRSEPICDLFFHYWNESRGNKNKRQEALKWCGLLINNNLKIEDEPFEFDSNKYYRYNENLRRQVGKFLEEGNQNVSV